MRQIILDTETTGLNPLTGDRIIEIGCLEMIDRRLTGAKLHHYINPQRDIDAGAVAVHGLTVEFLSDKPVFADVAQEIIAFLKDAEIIIHNAPFDVGFLDMELGLLKRGKLTDHTGLIVDTLKNAREMFPGKRNSLDALCERFGISNEHRTLHGALLDAELLAEVYLAMTRGQEDFLMDDMHSQSSAAQAKRQPLPTNLVVQLASIEEKEAHEAYLEGLAKAAKKPAVWNN
ncbi:MAG: DNA polymerase III subunit epsilon [Polynucleobacter sp.]|nr:MAG: DNA polymerase III subunit epsilon [Polynucleobacter sp.]